MITDNFTNFTLLYNRPEDISLAFKVIPTLQNIFEAFFIVAGLWALSKLFWMLIYEYRYGKGAGEEYLRYGKQCKQWLKRH
jgi:hypothetical protein